MPFEIRKRFYRCHLSQPNSDFDHKNGINLVCLKENLNVGNRRELFQGFPTKRKLSDLSFLDRRYVTERHMISVHNPCPENGSPLKIGKNLRSS